MKHKNLKIKNKGAKNIRTSRLFCTTAFLFVFLFSFGTVSQQTVAQIMSNFTTYNDPINGVIIDRPGDWMPEEKYDNLGVIVAFRHPLNSAVLGIVVRDLSVLGSEDQNISLDNYTTHQ